MPVWPGEDHLDDVHLNALLRDGGRWDEGPVALRSVARIGAEFGFSGRVYRLHVTTESGRATSVVAKFEAAEKIAGAMAFRRHNERRLGRTIPASFGSIVHAEDGRGLVLLEDVSPASQGDDSIGCTAAQAHDLIDVVAGLHAATWISEGDASTESLERWVKRDTDAQRWASRLHAARARAPEHFDEQMMAWTAALPAMAAAAHDELAPGPRAWIHRDPHLDNVLWRSDGTLVLLDWSNAGILPPALDVAGLLHTIALRDRPPITPAAVLLAYRSRLGEHGVDVDETTVRVGATMALRLLVRGMIGWCGSEPDPPATGRRLVLREQTPSRVRAIVDWLITA